MQEREVQCVGPEGVDREKGRVSASGRPPARACLTQPLEGAGPWERDLNRMHDLLRSQSTQSLDIEGFSFEGPALFLYCSDIISDCPP